MEESKKLSIAYCKKFLREHGKEYTDEEVAEIRETLYILAELDYIICMKTGLLDRIKPISEDNKSA